MNSQVAPLWTRIPVLPLRILVGFGCIAWGSYIVTMFRTSAFGLSVMEFLGLLWILLLFVVPLAYIVFLGLEWRRLAVGVVAVCITCLVAAEVFGRTQEILVVRRCGAMPTERVMVDRWWPFEDHSIYYVPGHGWSGGD